jgi:NAD(P)H-flavin reductase
MGVVAIEAKVKKGRLLPEDEYLKYLALEAGAYVEVFSPDNVRVWSYATFAGWSSELIPQIRPPGRGSKIMDLPEGWTVKKIPVGEPVKKIKIRRK